CTWQPRPRTLHPPTIIPRLKRTTLGHIREPKRYCAKMEAITVKIFIANEIATAIGISSSAANIEP
ncbi:MAG: hypothetical protein LUP91_10160, partial [Methylococcaceae bacterium]|nr:hypothetical protein [Methylococcaceae bacterium]